MFGATNFKSPKETTPALSDEEAKQKYPGGWKAPKPYLRSFHSRAKALSLTM
jgi:hypothetical protein